MNYFLHYSGKLPNYTLVTLNNLLSVDTKAEIYFCSDEIINYKNINYLHPKNLNSVYLDYIDKINYFENEKNPLWNASLKRIFYLLAMAEKAKVDEFVHFDLDVMIYKPFTEVKKMFKKNCVNITPMTEIDLIFGYSYIHNLSIYNMVCEDIIEILNEIKYFEDSYYFGKKVNEMMLLNFAFMKNPKNFNLIETFPNTNNKEFILFDPQQYGQYLSGIDKKPFTKYTFEENQYIGRELFKKNIKIKFNNGNPYAEENNKKYYLTNLHIHKKNLHKFKSDKYECLLK